MSHNGVAIDARARLELVRAHLRYDAETGEFFSVRTGQRVGFVNDKAKGYIGVSAGDWKLPAHRAAWALMTGEWPAADVDHINGDRADNRWSNLRACTRMQNMRNRRMHNTNTSGFTGVSWHTGRQRWCAKIKVAGKTVNLGRFKTAEAAALAYAAGAVEHHGEFVPGRIRAMCAPAVETAKA